MHLKYIKLVILKILFILGLSNFKFSLKIPLPPPPLPPAKLLPPQQYNHHHQNKSFWPPPFPSANTFLKFLTPTPPKKKVEGGAYHVFRGYRNGTLVENGLEEMAEWDTLKKWLCVYISSWFASEKWELANQIARPPQLYTPRIISLQVFN